MIRLENLTKSFWVKGERKVVIDNLSLTLPSGKSLALLGRNGAGKSTLLEIIAGTLHADSGRVLSDGTISWPVGLAASFHGDLTGAENVRFIARIYGVDTDDLVDFVGEFAVDSDGAVFGGELDTSVCGMECFLRVGRDTSESDRVLCYTGTSQ